MNARTIVRVTTMLVVMATTAANAQSAPAPKLNVGDKWVYNVKSGIGLSTITYQETREVTAVGGGGGKIKVTGKTADGKDFTRVDEYSGPGTLKLGRALRRRGVSLSDAAAAGHVSGRARASDRRSGST